MAADEEILKPCSPQPLKHPLRTMAFLIRPLETLYSKSIWTPTILSTSTEAFYPRQESPSVTAEDDQTMCQYCYSEFKREMSYYAKHINKESNNEPNSSIVFSELHFALQELIEHIDNELEYDVMPTNTPSNSIYGKQEKLSSSTFAMTKLKPPGEGSTLAGNISLNKGSQQSMEPLPGLGATCLKVDSAAKKDKEWERKWVGLPLTHPPVIEWRELEDYAEAFETKSDLQRLIDRGLKSTKPSCHVICGLVKGS
jgi:hypothetical protein